MNTKAEKIAAIVPMRHYSERVPGKNYRDFAGKPLYQHIVGTLKQCSKVSEIVIDTDSDVIIKGAREIFPEVKILKRPEHLRDDDLSMNTVLLNTISQIEADYFLQTHSTNPLLNSETIDKSIDLYFSEGAQRSVFGVTRIQARLYDAECKALNHTFGELIRTQDLAPVYMENSCLYVFNRENFSKTENRLGEEPLMFEIDSIEALDIDNEFDFILAESVFKTLRGNE